MSNSMNVTVKLSCFGGTEDWKRQQYIPRKISSFQGKDGSVCSRFCNLFEFFRTMCFESWSERVSYMQLLFRIDTTERRGIMWVWFAADRREWNVYFFGFRFWRNSITSLVWRHLIDFYRVWVVTVHNIVQSSQLRLQIFPFLLQCIHFENYWVAKEVIFFYPIQQIQNQVALNTFAESILLCHPHFW